MLATIGLILCRLVCQRLHSACHACQGHGAISKQQQAALTSCCDTCCILPALVSSSCCCSQCPDVVWGLQGWMHCILYVLFENAMGIVKLGAVVAGEGPHSPATLPETCGLIHHPCLHAAVCHHDHVQPHALHPQTACLSASACCHQYWAQGLHQHLLRAHERAKDAAVLAGPVLAPRALILCCAAGMLDLQKAQEWVVTTKLGSSDKRPGTSAAPPRDCRFYAGEMAMSTFVLTAAFYGIFSINRWSFSIFLTLQGVPRPFSSCSCSSVNVQLPPEFGRVWYAGACGVWAPRAWQLTSAETSPAHAHAVPLRAVLLSVLRGPLQTAPATRGSQTSHSCGRLAELFNMRLHC